MPRRREAAKREILPVPKFGNKLVTRFVNSLMVHGKKSTAEKIFYGSMDEITEKMKGEDSVNVFKMALDSTQTFCLGLPT